MSNLPALKPREVIRVLEKAGFRVIRTKGSHYILKHAETRKRVIVAYHNKEMRPSTLSKLIKESGLTEDEFIDLI